MSLWLNRVTSEFSFRTNYKPQHISKKIIPRGTPKGHWRDNVMVVQKGFRKVPK